MATVMGTVALSVCNYTPPLEHVIYITTVEMQILTFGLFDI